MYAWDPNKADANLAKHGVAFEAAEAFEWDSAIEILDERRHYGEVRSIAVGFIGNRLYVMAYARRSLTVRIISLRRANAREIKRYAAFHGA